MGIFQVEGLAEQGERDTLLPPPPPQQQQQQPLPPAE
jgi:hypothetical protein